MKILVYAEHRNGSFKKSTFEAVRAASTLASAKGGSVVALTIGAALKDASASLGGYGAERVLVVEDPRLDSYATSAYAKVIADAATKENADAVILSATAMGKDLAPRVVVRLDAGLASDCTAMSWDGDRIVARRPIYAGKVLIDVALPTAKTVFTLRPNVFSAGEPTDVKAAVETFTADVTDADLAMRVSEIKTAGGKVDVSEASMIVSGGRGMQGPEHFTLIEELAGVLNAATGASRAVVDAGWRPHAEQVGQTGKTVSPTLYIACGISGAIQHLAGMSSSKVIVAINKDKDAPIFQVADYGIVGDVFEVLPALTAHLKQYFGN